MSATAFKAFLECAAMFKAMKIDKADEPSGSAAGLGTALHSAIEGFVTLLKENNAYQDKKINCWAVMKAFWDEAYWAIFNDDKRYEEGVKILKNWIDRQVWTGRTVVSMEEKKFFTIKTSIGDVRVNYIMDRMDMLDSGEPEIIDYKSFIKPVTAGELKQMIQVRLYALAAQFEYLNAPNIWMVLDLLRYDLVGVRFSKAENRQTYKDLVAIMERIIASDGTKETLNESCRYCIRKHVCTELDKHAAAGGTLARNDGPSAAIRYYELTNIINALEAAREDLDKIVLADMEEKQVISYDGVPGYTIGIKTSSRRTAPEAERLAAIIGPDKVAQYGTMTVGGIDAMIKNEDFTPEQVTAIRTLIRKTYGEPHVDVKPIKVI